MDAPYPREEGYSRSAFSTRRRIASDRSIIGVAGALAGLRVYLTRHCSRSDPRRRRCQDRACSIAIQIVSFASLRGSMTTSASRRSVKAAKKTADFGMTALAMMGSGTVMHR